MNKTGKINRYLIFMFLLLFSIFQYGIRKLCGFTMYPDEFGYWASASRLIGYDWSETASLGSYYSFGYSLILFPILLLCENGIMAYRIAIFTNFLLMYAGMFLVQKIMGILFPEIEQNRKIFLSGIAVFYPVWIFYAQMTMAEGLLFFMFVLVLYLLLRFLEKQTVKGAVLAAIALAYMYCVHMRTVGVLIAGILTFLGWAAAGNGKERYLLIFTATLLFAGIAAFGLKNRTILQVFSFADGEMLSGNDYGSQWEKIVRIFAGTGFKKFIIGIWGKVFYLGLASFGTFYWAVLWCVEEIAKMAGCILKNGREAYENNIRVWAAVFLLLAATGEILISSIYMNEAGSIECLVYGRYNEFLIPVMIAIGITAMFKSRFLLCKTLLFGTAAGGMMGCLCHAIEKWKLSGFRGYHAAGISYLLQEKLMKEDSFNMISFFRNTWILGFGCMFLTAVLLWTARWRKSMSWIISGVLFLEIGAGMQISSHYTYPVNNINFGNLMIADAVLDDFSQGDEIAYLDEGGPGFIDFIQMQLREKTIHVLTGEILQERIRGQREFPDFLITDIETEREELLQGLYERKASANTFCLYKKILK